MLVHKNSIAEKSNFVVSLNYLIIPCPDIGIVDDKADVLAGITASMPKLCLVKQNILHGGQATQ